ncbi:unnamed protein product [Brassica oleracea]|uniref:Uncharacterized protein n=1 Tax=Brassica oleracea TaxID=3712 RepID=A0A3P6E4F7_BRAOL|nr:unnamed protein product [Brassica oleracea]
MLIWNFKTGTAAGLHISTLVWPVYSKDTLFAGYSENIYPCVGQQVEARTCFPPEVKRGPGRQMKSRWQSWLELFRMRGRTPRKQHIVYRCSVCKEAGHKRPQYLQVSRPEDLLTLCFMKFSVDDLLTLCFMNFSVDDLLVNRLDDLLDSRPTKGYKHYIIRKVTALPN